MALEIISQIYSYNSISHIMENYSGALIKEFELFLLIDIINFIPPILRGGVLCIFQVLGKIG